METKVPLKKLVCRGAWRYIVNMITAGEIEAAIAQLPSAELARLRDWLLARPATRPRTGAELAALWPRGFHLTTSEADEFLRDLEATRQSPPKALAWD